MGIAIIGAVFVNKTLIGEGPKTGPGFAIQPLSKGFSLAESGVVGTFFKDKLKSYPDSSQFGYFDYEGKDLEFNGECSDRYFTILIYDEEADYRANPSSAKFNQAFECLQNPERVALRPYGAGNKFKFIIDQSTGLAEGKYYIIIADQGKEGIWYNPR